MSTLIQPIALLAIILTGYLFKRAGKFKNRDYRIMQVALFNLVLPCAIIYSFATNPHDSSMLWISVFGFVVAFIPPVLIFLTTRHTPVQDRAFTMLNGSGFNIGCFCFPVVQAFIKVRLRSFTDTGEPVAVPTESQNFPPPPAA